MKTRKRWKKCEEKKTPTENMRVKVKKKQRERTYVGEDLSR